MGVGMSRSQPDAETLTDLHSFKSTSQFTERLEAALDYRHSKSEFIREAVRMRLNDDQMSEESASE